MQAVKTYVAALNAFAIESALQSPAYHFLGSTNTGREAICCIKKMHPHLLILQNELFGMDGLSILKKLKSDIISGFPYTVLLIENYKGAGSSWQANCGADSILCAPYDQSAFAAAIKNAMKPRRPVLSLFRAAERESTVARLLDEIKLPRKLKGYRYLLRSVDYYIASGVMRNDLHNTLYPAVAEYYGTSPIAVEKNIRTAIETTWLLGDLEAIQRLFGLSVDADRGKPTNSECISMLAEHASQRMLAEAVRAK